MTSVLVGAGPCPRPGMLGSLDERVPFALLRKNFLFSKRYVFSVRPK
ncbi:MAG TPA: hypothetical protein PK364_10995 [Synergistaceae bacterium]|nr:hypothetical protein [Synergistaceae bacterium]